ncbi:hypothetical protein Enr8_21470 [Blastopirellula retiformator]|uniref:Uncharacterized protein n=1 Tax=Blastopirellula retiformator TaxID=2527970 RepID=A0A5C5V9W2_9BACT|nr:hypothetical protein Enr8_21470 [Blastopirellula retiformator]
MSLRKTLSFRLTFQWRRLRLLPELPEGLRQRGLVQELPQQELQASSVVSRLRLVLALVRNGPWQWRKKLPKRRMSGFSMWWMKFAMFEDRHTSMLTLQVVAFFILARMPSEGIALAKSSKLRTS